MKDCSLYQGQNTPAKKRVFYLSILTLIYTVCVILWGAFVRATGSGAGCGEHWPLCNGAMIPRSPAMETIVEFGHRVTSGLCLILVVALTYLALKQFQEKFIRKFAWLSLLFVLTEAGVGALLVLNRLVGDNDSIIRAVVIALHLVNTYFLLAALSGVVWFARRFGTWRRQNLSQEVKAFFCTSAVVLLAVGATGAVVALGDTLFPAESLQHGLSQHFDVQAHFLVKLRWIHPVLAILSSCLMLFVMPRLIAEGSPGYPIARFISWMIVLQVALGVLNVALLAPVWMQILHLAVADVLWIAFCMAWFSLRYQSDTEFLSAQ